MSSSYKRDKRAHTSLFLPLLSSVPHPSWISPIVDFQDLLLMILVFATLKIVRGVLRIQNTQLVSLYWLASLEHVEDIVLLNNPNLVDARMPSLEGKVQVCTCIHTSHTLFK